MESIESQMERYKSILLTIAEKISKERNIEINSDMIARAIAELFDYTDNTQVYYHVLEKGEGIYDDLIEHSFSEILCKIELNGDECIKVEGISEKVYENKVKIKGQVWELHKSDHDPFSSNPHAHNYEMGLKLDLSNGDLYKKKQFKSNIKKKILITIRQRFEDNGYDMPLLNI